MLHFLSGMFASRSQTPPQKKARRSKRPRKFQPAVERLETRETPAATIATILQDVKLGPPSSTPTELVNFHGTLFFAADDGFNGRELWRSDGTLAGTHLFSDIRVGPIGSDPQHLTVVRDADGKDRFLYFTADDGIFGRELWMTNGTTGGTELVRDIHVGPVGSDPTELIEFDDRPVPALGMPASPPRLYFSANDGLVGRELWRSNGTRDSTKLVKDIHVGPGDSTPTYLTVVPRPDLTRADNSILPRALFFRADDGIHGVELWRTTRRTRNHAINTELVKDINIGPPSSNPFNLTAVGQTLFFGADDGFTGKELWLSNRFNQTDRVKDINPGRGDSMIESSTALMAQVFLRPKQPQLIFSADNGFLGQELWISNGTADGTQIIKDINPGKNGSNPMMQFHPLAERRALTLKLDPLRFNKPRAAERLLFSADDGFFGRELWRTDGTFAGTNLVKDINSGPNDGIQGELVGIVVRNKIFFAANNGDTLFNTELWTSNGFVDGTTLVQDINPGSGASNPDNFEFIRGLGKLFFAADDGIRGREPWQLLV